MSQGQEQKLESTSEEGSWREEPLQQKPGPLGEVKLSKMDKEIRSENGENKKRHPPRTATASTMDSQVWEEKDGQFIEAHGGCVKLTPQAALVEMRTPRVNKPGEQLEFPGNSSPTIDDAKLKQLQKHFNPRKQLRKLLLNGLYRWGLTAILILCLYMTLLYYSAKSVMSRAKKLQFNALIIGLSIGLSLSIAASLKEMALAVRWWILSRKKRSLHEVCLLMLGLRIHILTPLSCRWILYLTSIAQVMPSSFCWLAQGSKPSSPLLYGSS
jgi:hypothetical protein